MRAISVGLFRVGVDLFGTWRVDWANRRAFWHRYQFGPLFALRAR